VNVYKITQTISTLSIKAILLLFCLNDVIQQHTVLIVLNTVTF